MHAVELAQQEAEVSKLKSQLTAIEAAKKETESQLTETRRRSTQVQCIHQSSLFLRYHVNTNECLLRPIT